LARPRPETEPALTRAEKTRREVRQLLFFLVSLEALALVLLILGFAIDNDSLKVGAYALGMPITFALIGNLGLYLSWTAKK
jgi:hypothetical protein